MLGKNFWCSFWVQSPKLIERQHINVTAISRFIDVWMHYYNTMLYPKQYNHTRFKYRKLPFTRIRTNKPVPICPIRVGITWSLDHVTLLRLIGWRHRPVSPTVWQNTKLKQTNLLKFCCKPSSLYYFSLVRIRLFVIEINNSITELDSFSCEANLTDNFACMVPVHPQL